MPTGDALIVLVTVALMCYGGSRFVHGVKIGAQKTSHGVTRMVRRKKQAPHDHHGSVAREDKDDK